MLQEWIKEDILRGSSTFLVFYLRGRQPDREVHEAELVEGRLGNTFNDTVAVEFLTRVVRVPPRSR